jgi:hypothetical protein
MMSAAVAGPTPIRPTGSYTNTRDVTAALLPKQDRRGTQSSYGGRLRLVPSEPEQR